jgi:hypothetical protein
VRSPRHRALLDAGHVLHSRAMACFGSHDEDDRASCSITQNGRIQARFVTFDESTPFDAVNRASWRSILIL